MGRQSYVNGDHYHTVLWMREAMDRLSIELNKSKEMDTSTTKEDILEYLAFSTFKQGLLCLKLFKQDVLEIRVICRRCKISIVNDK